MIGIQDPEKSYITDMQPDYLLISNKSKKFKNPDGGMYKYPIM